MIFSLVDARDLHRDQGRTDEPEEAHLDADVLFAVGLVHEEIVDLTYLLARVVIDLVVLVFLLELS